MSKAAIYARKSKATEKGASVENQINKCKAHLNNLDITDVLIYKDDGFSGKDTDRPAFIQMMKDAKNKKFTTLICYKFDRVSRNVSDFSNLVDELTELGISFISLSEQFDTSTPIGKAMMNICSVFSQLERETTCLRVTDNMYALAESGYWLGGECPTGYKNKRVFYTDSSGKQKSYSVLEPIDAEVKLVKLIFEKYLFFGSLSKLEKYMLSNNIKTKRNKDFSKTSLSSILKNPAYVRADKNVFKYFKSLKTNTFGNPDDLHGVLIYKKHKGKKGKTHDISEWIYSISSHEGIIAAEDWLNVQKMLDSNKSRAPALGCSNTALLSGLVTCAKCNKPMRVAYGTKIPNSNNKRFYYMCTLKHNSGKTRCDSRNVNGIDLDTIVINKIKELSTNKKILLNELLAHSKSIDSSFENSYYDSINKEIESNNVSINNLLNNISLTTDEDIVKIFLEKISALKEKNKELNAKLTELNGEIASHKKLLNNSTKLIERLKNISKYIDTATNEEKKKLISSIIERVYVNGDTGAVNIKFKQPDN